MTRLATHSSIEVALNVWTNYMNSVAQTVIDFPVVAARKVA